MSRRLALFRSALVAVAVILLALSGCHSDPEAAANSPHQFEVDDAIVVLLHDRGPGGDSTTPITARVASIRADGSLVLDGRKHLASGDAAIDVALTGICRPEDVNADGTVLDSHVADLKLSTSRATP